MVAVCGIMLKAATFCDVVLPTEVANELLAPLHNVLHFGYTDCVIYTGPEFNAMGQLRYLLQGRRQVRAAPFDKLEQHISEESDKTLSALEVVKRFSEFDADVFKALSANCQAIAFEQAPKQMSYVPSGWIIYDQNVGGCSVIGLRTMAVEKSTLGLFQARLKSIIANPSPEHAAIQQMAKDFTEFVDTGIVPQHTDK